jgi:hypothetical protein
MIQNGRIAAKRLSERKTIVRRKDIDDLFYQAETIIVSARVKSKMPTLIYCYSMQRAQAHFNMSAKALNMLITRNEIQTFQKGSHVYVLKKDLNEIFNQNF